MEEREQQLLEAVSRLQDQQLEWTRELVRIPTVNPYSGDASAGSEAAGQEWLERRLLELGAQTRRVTVPADVYARGGIIGPAVRSWEGRDNVVGTWVLGDGRGPTVLINDHMDTVGTAGMTVAPHEPAEEAGRMYGRGTSDTKGNLVMGLVAVAGLLQRPAGLRGRIVFESVVDEECNGAGAGTLACCLAGVTGDIALCLDGDRTGVDVGCNGVATARVRVFGQAAHGSGAGAVSALDKGIAAKEAVDAFAAEHRKEFPHCPVNIGVFRAGTLPAIVPGEAELQINLNYDLRDAEQAARQLGRWDGQLFRTRFEQAMSRLQDKDEWFARHPPEVSWIKDMYPFWCDPGDPRVQIILAAAAQILGARVEARSLPAWFDAAHLARQLGIPAVGLGFGAPGTAHAAAEYVVLDDLFLGARALALCLHRLLRA
jgi:acetylornithine deacetylase